MAIRVRLGVLLAERRVSLTDLSVAVGVSVQNLSILKSGRARAIRFSTLEAICRTLDCTPGDLLDLEDEPDAARANAEIVRPIWGARNKRGPP